MVWTSPRDFLPRVVAAVPVLAVPVTGAAPAARAPTCVLPGYRNGTRTFTAPSPFAAREIAAEPLGPGVAAARP